MSSINHKNPKAQSFSPLNTRRTEKNVGQTYGERRDRIKEGEAENGANWLQRAKDKFFGAKKKEIENFADKNDRYGVSQKSFFSSNPIVERNRRTEAGLNIQSKTVQPHGDRYIRFLDSVIGHYTPVKKKT